MPIAPAIPSGGLGGWTFLQATYERQVATFDRSPDIVRETDHLTAKLSEPLTLDGLMQDRRLLRGVLRAFGLEGEVDKPAFVRRILEDGPDDPDGFARRLNNADYLDLAGVFSPGEGGRIALSDVQRDAIVGDYRRQALQEAVGEQDNDLRLAMNFQTEIATLAREATTDMGFWFGVLGSAPLREVAVEAFGLPQGSETLPVEEQAARLADKARARFGFDDARAFFATDMGAEEAIQSFLLRRQLASGPSALTPGASAIVLLGGGQGPGLGAVGLEALILSSRI